MFKSPPPPKKVKYLVLVFLVKYSWWRYKTQGRIGNHLPVSQFTLSGKMLAYFKIASVGNDWTHFWCHKFWNICNSFYHSLHSSVLCMWQFTAIKESISKLSKIKKLGSKQVFSAVRLFRDFTKVFAREKMGFTDLFRENGVYRFYSEEIQATAFEYLKQFRSTRLITRFIFQKKLI